MHNRRMMQIVRPKYFVWAGDYRNKYNKQIKIKKLEKSSVQISIKMVSVLRKLMARGEHL
jgi:hypothetical protein